MRLCPHCGTRKSVSLPATQRWGDTSMAQHWKKAGNKENDVDHEKQPVRLNDVDHEKQPVLYEKPRLKISVLAQESKTGLSHKRSKMQQLDALSRNVADVDMWYALPARACEWRGL